MLRHLMVAMCVFGLNAHAQSGALATPATASVEKKAAIAEMLVAINFKQMMSQMGSGMTQAVPQAIAQITTQLSMTLAPEEQAKIRDEAKASMATAMQEVGALYNDPDIVRGMEDIMARAYNKQFSIAEIKHITTFYKSDAGKKMLTTAPQLMQETMPELMALIAPKMNEIIANTAKKAVAKGETKKRDIPAK